MKIRWVQQDDMAGCAIACLAMVQGRSYQEVKKEVTNVYAGGMDTKEIDAYLFEKGYFIRRFYKQNWISDSSREEWPAFPARTCIASVRNDSEESNEHLIVVHDGVVLDPGDINTKTLDKYLKVSWIAGVYKPKQVIRKPKHETQKTIL